MASRRAEQVRDGSTDESPACSSPALQSPSGEAMDHHAPATSAASPPAVPLDLVVVGGEGHVGLPMSLAFAQAVDGAKNLMLAS